MPIDYSKYPPDWKTEIVPRILKRADDCCEFCGLENKSIVYSVKTKTEKGTRRLWFHNIETALQYEMFPKRVKVILTIAHLDHDETNPDVKDHRLRSLCQKCHLNYDVEEKKKRKKEKTK